MFRQFSSDLSFDFVADETSLEPAMKVLDSTEFEELLPPKQDLWAIGGVGRLPSE